MNRPRSASERFDRSSSLRQGLLVEFASILWMIVEAAVAIGVGLTTRSGAALAFGVDSLIELGSAGTLVWRLRAEHDRRPASEIERIERQASRIVGGALFALAGYVVIQSLATLVLRIEPAPSRLGIALAIAAMIAMPVLARLKTDVATAIGSAALKGDAACSLTCAYMAATLLGGLALNALFGWWWADPVAALGIVYFLIREGREAWSGACGCEED
ncbi:MAG TPA: cation transporter [Chloroflexota bacterium]|nr:cation transporter [Chloroflexota bacterium]